MNHNLNAMRAENNRFFALSAQSPLTDAQRVFFALHAENSREPFDLYLNGSRLARYRRATYGAGIDLGAPGATRRGRRRSSDR